MANDHFPKGYWIKFGSFVAVCVIGIIVLKLSQGGVDSLLNDIRSLGGGIGKVLGLILMVLLGWLLVGPLILLTRIAAGFVIWPFFVVICALGLGGHEPGEYKQTLFGALSYPFDRATLFWNVFRNKQ